MMVMTVMVVMIGMVGGVIMFGNMVLLQLHSTRIAVYADVNAVVFNATFHNGISDSYVGDNMEVHNDNTIRCDMVLMMMVMTRDHRCRHCFHRLI